MNQSESSKRTVNEKEKGQEKILIHPISWVHCHHMSTTYEFQSGAAIFMWFIIVICYRFLFVCKATSHQNILFEYLMGALNMNSAAKKIYDISMNGQKKVAQPSSSTAATPAKTWKKHLHLQYISRWAWTSRSHENAK